MNDHEVNQPIYEVEPASPDDAEAIFEVQRLTWIATYPNEAAGLTELDIRRRIEGQHAELIPKKVAAWREAIETGGTERATFVVKDNQKIIGFVAPGIIDAQRRIGAIYVLPGMQGNGIGKQLLQKALDWHGTGNDIFLHVASYNQQAISFYERNGFVKTNHKVEDDSQLVKSGEVKAIPEIEMVRKAA